MHIYFLGNMTLMSGEGGGGGKETHLLFKYVCVTNDPKL